MKRNSQINPLIRKAVNRTNLLVLGIFFLVWSINGFFIGGNILKLALLGSGFLLIVTISFNLKKDVKFLRFTFISFILLISYWFIAVLKSDNTINNTTIAFDVICFFLLLSGYLVVRNLRYFNKVDTKTILVISAFTIAGALMYVKFQSLLDVKESGNSRAAVDAGNDVGVNVIGVAYTNSIVFFILYYFLTYYQLKKWLRMVIILCMISTVFIIFSTESRGALIYLILILIANNLYKLRSIKKIFKLSLYLTGAALVAFLIYFQIIKSVPVLDNKINGAMDRFGLLSKIANKGDTKVDESAYQRTLYIKDFFNNLKDIIFWGEQNYKPYPHNQFLEIIMRWGIFFGMPLLFVSISCFFKSLRVLIMGTKVAPFVNLVILLFSFAFLQSLSSMSLDINRILWFGMGFIVGLPSLKKITNTKLQTNEDKK